MSNLLIAMVGLPRSGKSTIVKKLAKTLGAPIVQRDAIRLALHGERFQIEAEPMVKAMSVYMIRALFLAGHQTVICDETNFSRAARNAVKSADWKTEFYFVGTRPEVCKERAVATGQPDLVPVIEEMNTRWEPFEDGEVWIDATFLQDRSVVVAAPKLSPANQEIYDGIYGK